MATHPTSGTYESAGTVLIAKGLASKCKTLEYLIDMDQDAVKLADAEVANLFTLPIGTIILAGKLEVVTAQVGGTGTCTLTLAETNGSVALSAALSMSAAGVATAISAGAAMPYACAAANVIKVTAAVAGGTVTKNPTIKVTLAVVLP